MSALWFEKLPLATLAGDASAGSVELPLAALPRLAEAVLPDTGPVTVSCQLSGDQPLLLDARVNGRVRVACQRCLEPLQIEVDDELHLALSTVDIDSEQLPAGYELLVVPDGELRLADLMEDEVLLELPLAPRHPAGECGALTGDLEQLEKPAAETTTPFSGLADMLRDRH
ncbi:MAG: DUF177 domain-containing protein [Gammaproteobacteria bacterium]|nr:DUF177 domain-containing protein [Gammaproteobacteria bacterium]NNF59766.1 hypothetical protein [Gammaproteobacteria bacterium]NNM20960.1 hypothetical protein [Gammaproteobacteria bacterium]